MMFPTVTALARPSEEASSVNNSVDCQTNRFWRRRGRYEDGKVERTCRAKGKADDQANNDGKDDDNTGSNQEGVSVLTAGR